MDNTALLQNVESVRRRPVPLPRTHCSVSPTVWPNAAFEVGNLVQDAALTRGRRRTARAASGSCSWSSSRAGRCSSSGGAGASPRDWRRRDASLPTSDPAYGQKTIDEAAKRMGSTGHGTFDPDPTNSHDPDACTRARAAWASSPDRPAPARGRADDAGRRVAPAPVTPLRSRGGVSVGLRPGPARPHRSLGTIGPRRPPDWRPPWPSRSGA